jgi:hypothetical protein
MAKTFRFTQTGSSGRLDVRVDRHESIERFATTTPPLIDPLMRMAVIPLAYPSGCN